MKPTVGVIGLGLMGKPMAGNLWKAGFPVVIWNRTQSRGDELVQQGAKWAETPLDVATQVDVLLTMVSDPPALEEVLWGKPGGGPGALEGLRKGSM